MSDDARKAEQKLIDAEVEAQLRRYGAGNSRILRDALRARDLQWDAQRGTVTIQGYFVRNTLSEHLDLLRSLEPEQFGHVERVGSSEAPVPELKIIYSDDQAAINKNSVAIGKGQVVVVDRPRARRALAADEILSTDQQKINASWKQIAAGKVRVVDPDDLNL